MDGLQAACNVSTGQIWPNIRANKGKNPLPQPKYYKMFSMLRLQSFVRFFCDTSHAKIRTAGVEVILRPKKDSHEGARPCIFYFSGLILTKIAKNRALPVNLTETFHCFQLFMARYFLFTNYKTAVSLNYAD